MRPLCGTRMLHVPYAFPAAVEGMGNDVSIVLIREHIRMVLKDRALDVLRRSKHPYLAEQEMASRLSVPSDRQVELQQALEQLQLEGRALRLKGRWVDPARTNIVVGHLQCKPEGFGFLLPLGEFPEDVYVDEESMGEALHGDLVAVQLIQHRAGAPGRRRRRIGPRGRVLKVIVHRNRDVVGTYMAGKKVGRIVPDDVRLFRDIYVAGKDNLGAQDGDKVVVRITAWPTLHRNPEGEIVRVLGKEHEAGVDVLSVIYQFGLPPEFPAQVLAEAARLEKGPPPDLIEERVDFRDKLTVTIDPEDAKDYDDALSFYRKRDGRRVVLVHIADVSRFVRPESVLDMEARQRGLSVYLASDVVPMFPERQSRETFSLTEGRDRPAKTVVLEFDNEARVVRQSLRHSLVRVDRRMTYTEVRQVLDAAEVEDTGLLGETQKLRPEMLEMLLELDALAGELKRRRSETGSVDLDVREFDVRVGEKGEVISVAQVVRDRSHSLVEEFMLSANQAVARLLRSKKLPGLYRVHDAPEETDLDEFAEFVRRIVGKRIDPLDRKQLQALLADVSGTPVSEAVNMQLLRAMKRAQYSPSRGPHFALHFDNYCHFTSPVRRYPDLAVHQILDQFFAQGMQAGAIRESWKKKLPAIALRCNEAEQRANEAEREIVKVKLLRFLESRRHEVFDALITGVQEYGLFVQLQDYSIEGLVAVSDMKDDFYRLDKRGKTLKGVRTGKTYRLGGTLAVAVKKIDMARRQVDFVICD